LFRFLDCEGLKMSYNYADKSDVDIAKLINLSLLMNKGISEQDAGFDTVTSLNDAGLKAVARIVGKIRAAQNAAASDPIPENIDPSPEPLP